jgi:hypothetical protein
MASRARCSDAAPGVSARRGGAPLGGALSARGREPARRDAHVHGHGRGAHTGGRRRGRDPSCRPHSARWPCLLWGSTLTGDRTRHLRLAAAALLLTLRVRFDPLCAGKADGGAFPPPSQLQLDSALAAFRFMDSQLSYAPKPPLSSRLPSSHLIPSHLIPSHPILSHLIPSHPISSHLIPSHPISSHLTGTPPSTSGCCCGCCATTRAPTGGAGLPRSAARAAGRRLVYTARTHESCWNARCGRAAAVALAGADVSLL